MILRFGDTQEVPGIGTFEWDGHEFWVLGEVKHTYGEMYTILKKSGNKFEVKGGESS
jgi:hypothetical protein